MTPPQSTLPAVLDHSPTPEARAAAPDTVRLNVHSPAACAAAQPMTVGLPFPRGCLTDLGTLALTDHGGEDVPVQAEALARWPDGSVKWALADWVCGGLEQGDNEWRLHVADRPAHGSRAGVTVRESGASVVIDTGPAAFRLDTFAAMPLRQAAAGGRELLLERDGEVILRDARGRAARPVVESSAWEARGPVRATLRVEGRFKGTAPCRFVARLCFFAGTGLVRVRFTLHNPRRARHRGGLWDLGDPGSILFRELALQLGLAGANSVSWTAEPGQEPQSAGAVEIYQESSGGENWRSPNHVDHTGTVPLTFRGYRVRSDSSPSGGLRASPVVALRGPAGSVAAAVPEFWQQFPKAIEAEGGRLRVGLFPRQFPAPHELQGGEQKTHTVWLDFGGTDGPAALGWVHHPARAHAAPAWYASSGALPAPDADPDGRFRDLLATALEGDDSLFARREVIDEYGWRHYGDLYADHEAAYYKGKPPVISHYNNQYDVVYGGLLHYCRTGDRRWFDLFCPLARHVIDIDIYHTDRDKASYNGGLFWHTDHYRDAATCTHRAYSRANQQPGRPYGGGPCNEHNYTTGLLHYYYLTGDPLARDAVRGLADWVVHMEDGRRTVLAPLDDGPTGVASRTAQAEYHGPGRGCGNSVNALLDGWLLSGERRYLEAAELLIRRAVHPRDDVDGRDLLNVELRWSYTVFLTVLARYLDLKVAAAELDGTYAYARAALLRYAEWMAAREEPYFDHPEKLEFPTETWAAQELRKANVLRAAAAHADDPLRLRLLRRGGELAGRAWADLSRFERPATTRALAILLVEGLRDAHLGRVGPGRAPRPEGEFDFGLPERFVPQKLRVLARLRSVRGLAGALLRLADPRRWRYWLHTIRPSGASRDDGRRGADRGVPSWFRE